MLALTHHKLQSYLKELKQNLLTKNYICISDEAHKKFLHNCSYRSR